MLDGATKFGRALARYWYKERVECSVLECVCVLYVT